MIKYYNKMDLTNKSKSIDKILETATWRTRNSGEFKIKEMTTSHIKNTINFLERSDVEENFKSSYLELFHRELELRNLNITGDVEKDKISEKEQIYFLTTSCGYEILKSEKILEFLKNYNILDKIKTYDSSFKRKKGLEDWIKENNLVILEGEEKNILNKFKKDVLDFLENNTIDENTFYKYWNSKSMINIFSKEWKGFIDMMLGRKNEK